MQGGEGGGGGGGAKNSCPIENGEKLTSLYKS